MSNNPENIGILSRISACALIAGSLALAGSFSLERNASMIDNAVVAQQTEVASDQKFMAEAFANEATLDVIGIDEPADYQRQEQVAGSSRKGSSILGYLGSVYLAAGSVCSGLVGKARRRQRIQEKAYSREVIPELVYRHRTRNVRGVGTAPVTQIPETLEESVVNTELNIRNLGTVVKYSLNTMPEELASIREELAGVRQDISNYELSQGHSGELFIDKVEPNLQDEIKALRRELSEIGALITPQPKSTKHHISSISEVTKSLAALNAPTLRTRVLAAA